MAATRISQMTLAPALLLGALPAHAQEAAGEPPETPESGAVEPAGDREIYTPTYFARFAPRNALDMLEQVPGFSIQAAQQGRGLGQASGNVLLNGQRISSKSDSVTDRLRRVPASSVIRIEIVDGATLDISGLAGRVANVVADASAGLQGQFEWTPQLATEFASTRIYDGSVSVSGSSGGLDYTLALANDPFHGGTGGPNLVTGPDGVTEERFSQSHSVSHSPKLSAVLRQSWASGTVANVNASYEWDWSNSREDERLVAIAGAPAPFEAIRTHSDGYEYEIGGDLAFALGPGRLKLIAVESYDTSDFDTRSVFDRDRGDPAVGTRFTLASESGERIGRAEYSWPMWAGDWQLSAEAAFNRLDQVAGLFVLAPDGTFEQVPFPAGTGGVTEDRYETILSYSRSLAPNLSLQLAGGGEYSTIAQTGSNALSRSFRRPKGQLSLAWTPLPGLDVSFEAARKVGQLDFGDFLAEVNLTDDNANSANNELRPQQSWEFDLTFTRDLGAWGSVTVHFFDNRISDFITIVPAPGGGEAVGNIDSARVYGVTLDSTLRLDQLGLSGVQVDLQAQLRNSRLLDPVSGEERGFDRLEPRNVEIDLRHDVPGTDWAWGGGFRNTRFNPYYRVAEFGYDYNLRNSLRLFVEHKDVFGLTVQARVNNILEENAVLDRVVYAGPRNSAPVLFAENRQREIGKVVNFSVKGNF